MWPPGRGMSGARLCREVGFGWGGGGLAKKARDKVVLLKAR